ncbi:MAG: hypothetical protein WC829_15385 [Hyphomicrobium sp.]|jgi:hypothetical protein
MQPIETVQEFEDAVQQVDLSDHEPIVIDMEDDEDPIETFDQSH